TLFSKLRSSIGGVYASRAAKAESPARKQRMLEEADFAFRQAFALCPRSPEAVFRYSSLLASQGRVEEAIVVVGAAQKIEPEHIVLTSFLEQFKTRNRSEIISKQGLPNPPLATRRPPRSYSAEKTVDKTRR